MCVRSGLLAIVCLGLVTGILSGMMGVGGGIVMVPAMVLLLHLPQQDAQGISLLVIIPTGHDGRLDSPAERQRGHRALCPGLPSLPSSAPSSAHRWPLARSRACCSQIFAVFLLLVSYSDRR